VNNSISLFAKRIKGLFKWLARFISKKMQALQYFWGTVFGTRNYGRLAIVGYARTGSNYLASGLKSSKSIRLHHEIFAAHNREIGKNYEKTFSVLFQKQLKSIRLLGFTLFYYHLTDDEWEKFLRNDDIKIIHLTRKNYLKTIVSLDIAFKTDRWNSSLLYRKPLEKKIVIDVDALIERIDQIRAYEELTRERFKNWDYIEVVYENLVTNPLEEFRRIGAFLNVTDIDSGKIILRKQNPEKLSELIVNYSEVAKLLAKTKYAYLLEAEEK